MVNRILLTAFIIFAGSSTRASTLIHAINGNPPIPLLRLKLVVDSSNYDDIAIGFLSTATVQYNNQLDSRYLPGINAPEGLSSLSSDNVRLSVNILPLPKQTPLIIRLDVEAANSGQFTLQRTELDSIPQLYDIWLMDRFTKDSINLRTSTNYKFNINKNDTTTFGNNRFDVIIRQNTFLSIRLLAFDAFNAASLARISWTTENEQNSTEFTIERSIDEGNTFYTLDTLTSSGAGYYTGTDKNPVNGTDLYRLKIRDMNDVISYSNIVTLSFGNSAEAGRSNIRIYPNPSNGIINLTINPAGGNNPASNLPTVQTNSIQNPVAISSNSILSYTIKIINIKGTVIKSAKSSSTNWQDNISTLAPGTYIVQVIDNSTQTVAGKSTFIKL